MSGTDRKPMLTEILAQYIVDTAYDSLPDHVVAAAKERILDTLGSALAGYANWDYRDNMIEACRELGRGDYGILCRKEKEFPLARAAMLNATFAHAVELDDGHKNAGVHAGAAIVPTALAVGEAQGSSGKDILTAVVIGYEIVYRIATQMSPHQIQKGFHPSGNCNTFGAMAVAGKLMGLSADQLANGLGLAGLHSAGLMEATKSGQQSKCILVGNAVYNGISAALMAAAGMEGTRSVLEGKTGIFAAQAEAVDPEVALEGLGEQYLILDTYSKLYPTCRHSQPAIEAAIEMMEREGFAAEEVAKVHVGTHQVAYDLTGTIYDPQDAGQAKFSLPYGVAIALVDGTFAVRHLQRCYRENKILLNLAKRVEVCVDPHVQAKYPQKRGAKVTIHLKDGRCIEQEYYVLKGSPDKPVGWAELAAKFHGNASGTLCDDTLGEIEYSIKHFEALNNGMKFLQLLNATS